MYHKSFRAKIILSSTILSLLSLTLIAFNTKYFQRKDELLSAEQTVKKIETDVLKSINCQNNFFSQDRNNPKFFKSGTSENLYCQKALTAEVTNEIEKLKSISFDNHFKIDSEVAKLQTMVIEMQDCFQRISTAIFNRGYHDFGYEGKMRTYIHELEEIEALDKAQILSLRRHEKDFIMRQDLKYVNKLEKRSQSFKESIKQSSLSEQTKNQALEKLQRYNFYFSKLVESYQILNISGNGGLHGKLEKSNAELLNYLSTLKELTANNGQALFLKFRNSYAVLFSIVLLLQIWLSFLLSKRLTKPLIQLSNYIEKYVSNGFKKTEALNLKSRKDEFGQLGKNFNLLEKELHGYVGHFKEMVEQRTYQLSEQNEALVRSKMLIQSQNKDLLDNITYAKRIQNALLPKANDLTKIFPDHFLIYKPKDIVSGDFYWTHQTSDFLYFAVGDCTGHGVTGAFMSLLGISTLNEIVKQKKVVLPNELLMTLNRKIIEVTRKSSEGGINDGMDIAMCMVNRETNQLYFSGAGRPMLFKKEGEIHEVPGDKRSIAGFIEDPNYLFEQHQYNLSDIDSVYLFSDGVVDQFGGENGKKFKKKRLIESLKKCGEQAIIQQEIYLANRLEKWMTNEPQVDDICFMGIDLYPINWPTRQFNREIHSLLHK